MSVIPRRVIFAWYGRDLPLMVRAAVRSAIEVLKPDETLLIHAGLEADTPGLESLRRRSGFVTERVGADWFAGLPAGGDMARLHDRVPSAAAKANILRLAALWKLGGLYLDTDTVAVRDLGELWDRRGLCGLEPVALPPELYRSRDPLRWTGAGVKLAVREILARVPGGARAFRSIRGWYRSCVNNAVLGSCARNPLLGRAFELIAAMDERERLRKYRLGPHLLQALTENVQAGTYLGVRSIGGRPCHHLLFTQEEVDWQVWVDAGESPLPRKLVITRKKEPGQPQFSAELSGWDLAPALTETSFDFKAPAGAKPVKMSDLREGKGL